MCELATAALAVAAVGAGVSAYGQYQAGQAAKDQASYQSAVARNNAILAERAAQDALARGELAERKQNIQTAQLLGRQKAVFAANGVDPNLGSALDLTTDTAGFGKLDALTIRANAEREALNYRTQGMNFQGEAGLADARGRSAATAGMIGAGSTALTGAGSVASKWYDYSNKTGYSLFGGG